MNLVNCGHGNASKTSQSASPSLQQPPPSASPPKPASDARSQGPAVLLDAAGVKLDGTLVAPPITGKPERIDPLWKSLKERRAQSPAGKATDTYQLSVQATSNVPTFKSAFQTAAFAGWQSAYLQTPAGPVLLSALVPWLPDELRTNPPAALDAPVVLVARAGSSELWMNATIVSAHLPPTKEQGGLGITGLTPENDVRVRVKQWDTSDVSKVTAELGTYCRSSAPCPRLALIASNDMATSRLLDLLQAVRHVCTESQVADCEIGFRLSEPPQAGTPPDRGAATARAGGPSTSGMLPPAMIQPVVRSNFGAMRECYQQGQARDPNLRGKVVIRFVIGRDGKVARAELTKDSTLPDAEAGVCVVEAFKSLKFPEPDGGVVTVVYPIVFEPE